MRLHCYVRSAEESIKRLWLIDYDRLVSASDPLPNFLMMLFGTTQEKIVNVDSEKHASVRDPEGRRMTRYRLAFSSKDSLGQMSFPMSTALGVSVQSFDQKTHWLLPSLLVPLVWPQFFLDAKPSFVLGF